jgi:hypothetical protein
MDQQRHPAQHDALVGLDWHGNSAERLEETARELGVPEPAPLAA